MKKSDLMTIVAAVDDVVNALRALTYEPEDAETALPGIAGRLEEILMDMMALARQLPEGE